MWADPKGGGGGGASEWRRVGVRAASLRSLSDGRWLFVMAVNVLMPLLIPLGEQITNETQLTGVGNLVFTHPKFEVFVKENTSPVLLLTLQAASNSTDADVMYSVVAGGLAGLFLVDGSSGHLTLTSPLDYEARHTYEVIVGGQAAGERAFARVVVRVRDVNDLPPTFSRPLFETQITEEDDRHLPKPILQVSAMDGDVSDESRLVYTLTGDGVATVNSSFSVSDNSGHIHLLRPLDRDAPTGRARWELQVSATDGIHEASALVHVNVKDINDNAPFFSTLVINGSVPENAKAGSEVTQVSATDYDDPLESTNAILTYAVEKNVIDELSGQPIFTIDPNTGRITTALCCLDREKTPTYAIQVVASDGGGLKGTGTVLVVVGDENDVSPKFSRAEWLLTVHESVPLNTSLAFLTVDDPDITNDFAFRVVKGSGHGWERFRVVPSGNGSGSLQAVKKLDFEDPVQRQGFKFRVQVSDQGDSNWESSKHVDSAWVLIKLLDDNDNAPQLSTELVNLTLPEDVPVGRSLATFTASDRDQGGKGEVHYAIEPSSDPGRRFAVDSTGRVRLQRGLDREASPHHTVLVLAMDRGEPPRTSTATLLITLSDINDNAPHVASPDGIFVTENSGPQHVADLTLDDPDDWSLGHGPPFSVALDSHAPRHIKETFAVDFDQKGDEGRGVAVVTSLAPLDREVAATRLLPLVVGDARGLTATTTITLTVADLNDNLMSSADKTVTVIRLRGETEALPLGRVYVDDPDDWDVADKTWSWRTHEKHPLFALDSRTGELTMSGHARDSTYFLQFWVSDVTQRQVNVPANVTVSVTSLSRDVIKCAVPITITTHTPQALIAEGLHVAGSALDALLTSVESIANVGVRVISLESQTLKLTPVRRGGTRVWLTARSRQPLDQLLLLHRRQISSESGVGVVNVGVGACVTMPSMEDRRAWVVDANKTALVTPRLDALDTGCSCHAHPSQMRQHLAHLGGADQQPSVAAVTHTASCQPNPCLNGGRCIALANGPRCVCPEGTAGSLCKQLSRHFRGEGWVWAAPIPPCSRAHISLEIRTTREESLLLYAGPGDNLAQASPQLLQEDVLSLELRGGRPRLMLDLGSSPILLEPAHAHAAPNLADGRWHRLDVVWGDHRVDVVSDLCLAGGECRLTAPLPATSLTLGVAAPLQVGGLANPPPDHHDHGWPAPLTARAFLGCIRNLRVNGELRDLGDAVLGEGSSPGCFHGDACADGGVLCPKQARCVRSDAGPKCECLPGWEGDTCHLRTQPASFSASSYVKVALSAVPPPNTTTVHLRFRTWESSGQLLALSSQHGRDLMAVHLVGGQVCLKLALHQSPTIHLCLQQVHLNDGKWHAVRIERFGQWAELVVDEGDGPLYNATATPSSLQGWSTPFLVDRQEGVHVGGSPEYVGVSLFTVHHDFHDGCLDDLRVSGVSLPLPPLVNTSAWAQATMFTNVQPSCAAPAACANVTCPEPLTCIDVWRRHQCGCSDGSTLTREGGKCRDVNECVWSPCLNGGTCVNQDPGYFCVCPKTYIGDNCEGAAISAPSLSLSVGALVTVVVFAVLLFAVVLAAYLVHRRRRQKRSLSKKASAESSFVEKTTQDDSLHDGEHDFPADVIELHLAKDLKFSGERSKNGHEKIAGVDVLRHDGPPTKRGEGGAEGGCGCPHLPSLDDLRNYAYEGDGSSPGSLSSCCSGGDGGGEARLLGGFQDVATLLNCLGGQPEGGSPSHSGAALAQPNKKTPASSSFGAAAKAVSGGSPSATQLLLAGKKAEKGGAGEAIAKKSMSISMSKADTLEIGLHSGGAEAELLFQPAAVSSKCHSLPRLRVPTIFVNNLHGDPGDSKGRETYHYSLKRNKAPFAVETALGIRGNPPGCYCAQIPPPAGFEENPSVAHLKSRSACRACVTVALQSEERLSAYGIPRRSLSASTVSYLTPAGLNTQLVQPAAVAPLPPCGHRTCSSLSRHSAEKGAGVCPCKVSAVSGHSDYTGGQSCQMRAGSEKLGGGRG
ncbi:putative neural-cadherin 2 [Penaeus chinensis]|uniref:putative neural-cadherin 2 n=1 Tax=Penaeus chinensis TaxID=139456 RepID=UPI001FB66041|nr:putative neural-cadherin 2 [Penaeus chinensis]